ncbi:MAG: NADH-quinone oxidoreductase subunit C [Verrucomicrobia bacterium]|nr:NADH-quinone oxidoreductase subunit C [Lachnospiraceae bacterium]MBR4248523.1 NADH-quinone oxidoreductase subunit C [Verrucomicrobiota bacterium]
MQYNNKHVIKKDEVVSTAKKMKKAGNMLGMIHGHIDKEGKKVITYDYFIGENVESYEVVGEDALPTISDIYQTAASWAEREIGELIGMKFEGLDMSKRLFLPNDLLEGEGQILVTPLAELREKNIGVN